MSGRRHRPRADGWQGECDEAVWAFLSGHEVDQEPDLAVLDAASMLDGLSAVRDATCIADCALDALYRRRAELWSLLEFAGVSRSDMAARSGVDRNVIDQAFSAARRKAAKE